MRDEDDFRLPFDLSSFTIHLCSMTPPKLCGDCGTQMEVNPDLFALPGLDAVASPDGLATGLQFNFNRALPVTVYICPNCGRFKFISAIFLNNVELPRPAAPEESVSRAAAPQNASSQDALPQDAVSDAAPKETAGNETNQV